jgi:hypothetical protein
VFEVVVGVKVTEHIRAPPTVTVRLSLHDCVLD